MKQKNLLLIVLPALLIVLLLSGAYVSSPAYTGLPFSEEAADHEGIYLEDDTILVSNPDAVLVEGTTATIVKGGEYKLSGSLGDGQIIVDVSPEEQVTLKLDNVDLHCEHSAPIWAKQADRLKLSLPEDSINFLSDGPVYSNPDQSAAAPSACVYAQCDLTIKGKGQLTVDASFRNGIHSTDSLLLKGGVVLVNAPHYALRGKDDVTMVGGIFQLQCQDNALSSAGFVDIQGGDMSIETQRSAISAVTGVTVGEQSRVRARCGPLSVRCNGPVNLAYDITEGVS